MHRSPACRRFHVVCCVLRYQAVLRHKHVRPSKSHIQPARPSNSQCQKTASQRGLNTSESNRRAFSSTRPAAADRFDVGSSHLRFIAFRAIKGGLRVGISGDAPAAATRGIPTRPPDMPCFREPNLLPPHSKGTEWDWPVTSSLYYSRVLFHHTNGWPNSSTRLHCIHGKPPAAQLSLDPERYQGNPVSTHPNDLPVAHLLHLLQCPNLHCSSSPDALHAARTNPQVPYVGSRKLVNSSRRSIR